MKEATAVNQLKAILRHMRARNMPESLEMTNAIADLQDELTDLQQQLTEANKREAELRSKYRAQLLDLRDDFQTSEPVHNRIQYIVETLGVKRHE
jgi:ElaB/YqjD/DUF883 family membrane-anchored ribosome-binding protein